jgi:hypothetical protein
MRKKRQKQGVTPNRRCSMLANVALIRLKLPYFGREHLLICEPEPENSRKTGVVHLLVR